ncbi:MAG: LytTR family DNA-binding domain-containing protein [Chitinophagaceae bacterium]
MVAAIAFKYALVTLVLSLFCTTVVRRMFPRAFDEKHWTVLLEMIFLMSMVLVIAFGNLWLTSYVFGTKISAGLIATIIKYTLFIGIAPVMLSVLLKQQKLLSKYSGEAGQIEQLIAVPATVNLPATDAISNEAMTVEPGTSAKIAPVPAPVRSTQAAAEDNLGADAPVPEADSLLLKLKGNNQSEHLQITVADFLFAEAADNYTSIHYLQKEVNKQLLFRVPVNSLEAQTAGAGTIFRCHKSYLVNLQHVTHISGNAQGYTLHLLSNTFEVPVSRTLNSLIKEKIAMVHKRK